MNLNELVSKVKSLKEAFLLEDNKILPDSYGNPSLRPESARAIARKEFHDGIEKLLSETQCQALLDYVRMRSGFPITNLLDCFEIIEELIQKEKGRLNWSYIEKTVKKDVQQRDLMIKLDQDSATAGKSFSTYTLQTKIEAQQCINVPAQKSIAHSDILNSIGTTNKADDALKDPVIGVATIVFAECNKAEKHIKKAKRSPGRKREKNSIESKIRELVELGSIESSMTAIQAWNIALKKAPELAKEIGGQRFLSRYNKDRDRYFKKDIVDN